MTDGQSATVVSATAADANEAAARLSAAKAAARKQARTKWLVRAVSVVVVFTAWQIYGSHVSTLLLVPPSSIAQAFGQMVTDGSLVSAAESSLLVLVVGFGLALVLAIPGGLLLARFVVLDWALQPYISAIYSTPLVALVPVYILIFGFGFSAKVAIVCSFSFFPLLLNTYQGAGNVDKSLLDVSRSLCASEFTTFRHVVAPSAFPYIIAGINVSLGHALSGLIISEFYTNATGLGGLTLKAADTFQTARMYAPIAVVMALGIILMASTRNLKRRLAPWSNTDR